MKDKEILEKAIQKAIDGGWAGSRFMPLGGEWMGNPPKWRIEQPFGEAMIIYTTGGVNCLDVHINTEHVIFNHDFAKAIWPGERIKPGKLAPYGIGYKHNGITASWEYHLQQMVIADDPIKYLGNNLK